MYRVEAGRAFLYSLNREHLLAPAVEAMAGVRWELVQRLRTFIGRWNPPTLHASLFGSAARGEGNAASDIDLLVVRPKAIDPDDSQWRRQLDELAERVLAWTGNHAGIVELSESDVSRVRDERPPVAVAVAAEGVDLVGVPLRKLIGRR